MARARTHQWPPGTPVLPLAVQLPRDQQGLRPRVTLLVGLTTTPSPPCQGQTMPNAGGQPGLRAQDRGGWSRCAGLPPRTQLGLLHCYLSFCRCMA